MPRPSPSPFPTNRPNFFVEPSTTIESLRNSSTRCEPLASRCSSTPSKDPLVEKEEYHPKCALSSRHSCQSQRYLSSKLSSCRFRNARYSGISHKNIFLLRFYCWRLI